VTRPKLLLIKGSAPFGGDCVLMLELGRAAREQGFDVEAYLWVGVFTTAGIPDATLTQLRDVVRKVAMDPTFKDALVKVKIVPDYRDTPDFKTFFDADYKRLARAVQRIGKL